MGRPGTFTKERNPGGGRRPGAGRKSKAEVAALEQVRLMLEAELAKYAKKIAQRYRKRALAKTGDRVLTHAVERVLPPAKQAFELDHKGQIASRIVIETIDPDADEKRG